MTGESICMIYKFIFMPSFDQCIKHLKKHYRNIAFDVEKAIEAIEENPEVGAGIPNDYTVRKLRVASQDM